MLVFALQVVQSFYFIIFFNSYLIHLINSAIIAIGFDDLLENNGSTYYIFINSYVKRKQHINIYFI